jgi:hypothetical protein
LPVLGTAGEAPGSFEFACRHFGQDSYRSESDTVAIDEAAELGDMWLAFGDGVSQRRNVRGEV